MAKLPVFFTASTKAIAEKAIQRGILKYPGLCYIEDGNVIAWMTEDNEIRYVGLGNVGILLNDSTAHNE